MKPLLLLSACALASSAFCQTHVETFANEINPSAWNVDFQFGELPEPTGGNPGAHLFGGFTSANTTQFPSPFTGDFRARGVTLVGIDAITLEQDIPGITSGWELTLQSNSGTPSSLLDDCWVRVTHPLPFPIAGEGWKTYEFDIPSASTQLPANWTAHGFCADDDAAWNAVITNVTSMHFRLTPGNVNGGWRFGIDNPRISEGPGVPSCFGEGQGAPCPCSNAASPGANTGCINTSGVGASLHASGTASVSNDSLSLNVDGAPTGSFAVLVSAQNLLPSTQPGVGIAAFDGLRCVGGGIIRHGTRAIDSTGAAASPWGAGGSPPGGLAAQSGFVAGDRRHFQVFYRELLQAVCGTGQNTSNAYSLTFRP